VCAQLQNGVPDHSFPWMPCLWEGDLLHLSTELRVQQGSAVTLLFTVKLGGQNSLESH
jgi:hypothetical protein